VTVNIVLKCEPNNHTALSEVAKGDGFRTCCKHAAAVSLQLGSLRAN
jgi:hypothetical protein